MAALPFVAGSEDWAHLIAAPAITMAPTAWRDGTSKGAIPMPSSELLPVDSLSAMGSLEACLGATGVLAGADALVGIEALEAADREPLVAETNPKIEAGAVDRFEVMGATT